jgi:hypothetical protein
MEADIAIGTPITYHDSPIGFIERAERSAQTGQVQALILRSGRSPALLRIGSQFVQRTADGTWRVDPDLELDALEQEAMESGVLPPVGAHLADGPTA